MPDPALPPGFVEVGGQGGGGAMPPLPPGFVMQGEEPAAKAEPGLVERMKKAPYWPIRLAGAAADAFTLPGDVMAGRVDPMSDEAVGRAAEMAGFFSPASAASGMGRAVAARAAQPQEGAVAAPALAQPAVAPRPQEIVRAFDASGVTPSLPTAVQNRGVSGIAHALNETIVGTPISRGTQQQVEQAARRVDDIAGTMSPVAERATAGERIQAGAENFRQNVAPARQSDLYSVADDLIDPAAVSALPRTRQAVEGIASHISNPQVRDFVTDNNFNQLAELLRGVGPQGLSFSDLRQLRTQVRQLRPAEGSKVGINKVAIDRIYSALTDDMHTLARQSGGEEGLRAIQMADRWTRALETTRSPALEKIIGAKSGEQVFAEIARLASETAGADWRKLVAIRRSVPAEAWNDMAAATLRNMGRQTPGARTSTDAVDFSPATFLTNFGKLSPRGQEALFGGAERGELRTALRDLTTVLGELKRVQSLSNPSGTGRLAVSAAGGAGLVTAPIATAILAAGGHVMARAMMNPRVVRFIAGAARAEATAARGGGPEAVARARRSILGRIPAVAGRDRPLLQFLQRAALGEAVSEGAQSQ